MYTLYLSKVLIHAKLATSFYLRPHRDGGVEYENSVVGVCMLNKILPELCEKADLERKTAHSLHIMCASRLFQSSVEEKLARELTGHRSNVLFGYQKSSADQVDKVSEVLGPSIDNCHKEVMPFGDALNDTILDDIVANIPLPEPDSMVDNFLETLYQMIYQQIFLCLNLIG